MVRVFSRDKSNAVAIYQAAMLASMAVVLTAVKMFGCFAYTLFSIPRGGYNNKMIDDVGRPVPPQGVVLALHAIAFEFTAVRFL